MINWLKENGIFMFWIILTILLGLFVLINIFWVIYAFVKYGNCPISEIPAWALFYLLRWI